MREMNLWEVMPAVALRGLTVFPNMIIHFDVSRQKSIIAVEQAMMQEQKIFLVAQKDLSVEEPTQEDVYEIGTLNDPVLAVVASTSITMWLAEPLNVRFPVPKTLP